MKVKRVIESRCQYLYIHTVDKKEISAARYLITPDRYSPWLITHGKEELPENPIKRGIYLTKIFNQH